MDTTLLLTGIGLKNQQIEELLATRPKLAWVEVHSENFFAEGGKNLELLMAVREYYPVSLHGIGLSLGSSDELNWQHVKQLRDLTLQIDPCLVSDHLAWTSINGHYVHDLLPLPYTDEALNHVADRIKAVQDYLGRQLLVENISSYVSFADSTYLEADFLMALTHLSGCGLLLDINNIFVTAQNLQTDPYAFINAINPTPVQEIHLGGFSIEHIADREVLIDTHNQTVAAPVWELFHYAVKRLGTKPTIIEWDNDLPSLSTLCQLAEHAETIMREIYVPTKLTG